MTSCVSENILTCSFNGLCLRFVMKVCNVVKCNLIKVKSLEHRRPDASATFVSDLLSGRINSASLLSLIDFNVFPR